MLFALFCRACHAYNTNDFSNEPSCSGTELEWEVPEWEEPGKCPDCRGQGYVNCSKCKGVGCSDCGKLYITDTGETYKGFKCKAHSSCSLARSVSQHIYGKCETIECKTCKGEGYI